MKILSPIVKKLYSRPLVKGLFWSGVGGITSSFIMLIINLAASNWLPPTQFGYYNSLISLATGLTAFMLMGSNLSCVRFICEPKNANQRGEYMTASIGLVLIQVVIIGSLIFWLKIYPQIWLLILMAGLLTFKELTDSLMRAFGDYKIQSIARICGALLMLAMFLYLRSQTHLSGMGLVEINGLSAALFIIYTGWYLKRYLARFTLGQVKTLIKYNIFLTLNSISGFITGIEKYIIGTSVGLVILGQYSIYYNLSFLILSNFGSILMNAYWPYMVNQSDSINNIRKRQNKWLIGLIPVWVICCLALLFGYKIFFPGAYQISNWLIIAMSLASASVFMFSVSVSLLNVNQIKWSALLNIITYGTGSGFILLTKDITKYSVFQIIWYSVMNLVVNWLIRTREDTHV